MTAAVLPAPFPGSLAGRLKAAPVWALCLLALAVFTAMEVWAEPGRLALRLGDSDDATRLTGVRELLAGAPWFDTTLPRFGGPSPLVSHWSRLVDAPLALLIGLLRLFMSNGAAETAVRALWPLLVFLPLLTVLARHAALSAGRTAAVLALGFAVYAHSGVGQFAIGRIDHHNVMILAAVAGMLLLAESFRSPRRAWLAGVLLGLGTAVGYEALVLTVSTLCAAAFLACWRDEGLESVSRAALAFAATLVAAIVVTIPPERWLVITCDAVSANLAVLAVAGAAGLTAANHFRARLDRWGRLAIAAAPAVPAAVLYGLMEPACLDGPFGQVDPAVFPIWLSDVQEAQSLFHYMATAPQPAVQFTISALLGVLVAWRNTRGDRSTGALFSIVALGLATALAVWQIKLMPYATFLAVPAMAIFVARLRPVGELSALAMRLSGFFLLNQHTILIPILLAAKFATAPAAVASSNAAGTIAKQDFGSPMSCMDTAAIAPLAALPAGLMLTDADFGPFIVALTGLSVVSAPYHRLDKAILETEAIKGAPPELARRKLAALGVSYVAICKPFPPRDPSPETFAGGLHAGVAPGFLEPVPLAAPTPFRVWRLRRP